MRATHDSPAGDPRRPGAVLGRGLWVTLLGPAAVEALPTDGLDWLAVDLQHGQIGTAGLVALLRAARVPVLARAASQDPAHLARVLDTGVAGVIVPGVASVEDVQGIVAAVRFPPEGTRSSGLSREAVLGVAGRPLVLPMVETRPALQEVEDLAAVPGIDGLFVGPYDLALSLGCSSVLDDAVVAAVRHVAETARNHGLLSGAFSGDRDLDARLPQLDLLAPATDVMVLGTGLASLFPSGGG